jgi:chromosome segregation ATPase
MENDVRLAVLEQKVEDLKPLVVRIDTAIEKLSEVSTSVSRMLAVHEERISKQEEIENVQFDKIDKLREKMDSDHKEVQRRLNILEKKMWIAVGASMAFLFLVGNSNYKLIDLNPLTESDKIVMNSKL